jgi:predicted RNA-binding protein YlxR (DUF448 family)
MAKIISKPTRMCVVCRERYSQSTLIRIICSNGELKPFKGIGRSFYLCDICINNEKKLTKSLMRQCKTSDKNKLMIRLKEIITDDRKS